jgi:hypothetical protein
MERKRSEEIRGNKKRWRKERQGKKGVEELEAQRMERGGDGEERG